jgi:hypothetical protein
VAAHWSASETVVQLDVVCDLDAVAGAILDNSRFEHVSVASTEDIHFA